ncbi:hypothetical protein Goshw_018010 [Gossypium schwendimanii]|uniref:Uncharacterized protein n=1 Tax=Gossypium schwendimanii TaxID=34291 RepID=A0A7J9KLZ7_GOSSC|nr:hypothetical protein [Gossypium schwendimanii]
MVGLTVAVILDNTIEVEKSKKDRWMPWWTPIELQVEGIVKASADPSAFNEPKWIAFNRIENFKLSGGGVFDSQGTTAYKREGCEKHDYCDSHPIISSFLIEKL